MPFAAKKDMSCSDPAMAQVSPDKLSVWSACGCIPPRQSPRPFSRSFFVGRGKEDTALEGAMCSGQRDGNCADTAMRAGTCTAPPAPFLGVLRFVLQTWFC